MLFNHSKPRAGKRKKSRKKHRPFFARVNTSVKGRHTSRKQAARRIAALLIIVGGVLVIRTGTQWATRTLLTGNELFRIRKFDINCYGDIIKWEHIMEYARLNTYSNLFEVDIHAVKKHLVDSVPRIESVSISRLLKGVLDVEVRERIPIARLSMESYYLEIDTEGYVLGPWDETTSKPLPVISGHYAQGLRPGVFLGGTKIMNALEILDICENTPVGQTIKVTKINLSDRNALEINIVDDTTVLIAWRDMGDFSETSRDDLERKMVMLIDNIREAATRRKHIVHIDMTMEKNFPARTVRVE